VKVEVKPKPEKAAQAEKNRNQLKLLLRQVKEIVDIPEEYLPIDVEEETKIHEAKPV
jgi:hypothetical protein